MRLYLLMGNVKASLQSADADVDVGGLRRHRQSCRRRTRLRSLILGQCRFPSATQATEYVQLPSYAEVGLIGVAVAIEIGP